jgi:hypothetical protein
MRGWVRVQGGIGGCVSGLVTFVKKRGAAVSTNLSYQPA